MVSELPIHLPGKPGEGVGYCVSHYLGIASYVMLLIGLGLGLYTRWWETGDSSVFIIALIGVFIFSFNVVLCYYFSFHQLSAYVSHLWFGSLLGIITFTQWQKPIVEVASQKQTTLRRQSVETYHFDDFSMNILLMVSLLLQANWIMFARGTRRTTATSAFLKAPELLEILGMIFAGLFNQQYSHIIILLTISFALSLGLLRVKSSFGLVNLILLFFLSLFIVIPSSFQDAVDGRRINVYALACFCGRHLVEPLIDVYFNGLLPMERWSWFIQRHSAVRKLLLVFILVGQMAYCVYLGLHVPRHSSFLIMTPIYAAFGFVYFAYHLIVFITNWCLMNKITECLNALETFSKGGGSSAATISLSRVMASRGIRHMCLIARRLAAISAFMTLILTFVGWKVKTGLTLTSFLNILPIDLLLLALVVDLSASLGGTCAGFALVVPSTSVRADSSASSSTESGFVDLFPALLPPRTIEIISERATRTLNLVQRFFGVHLISNCGSEYSSSGLSVESLLEKLNKFFRKKTDDLLPFDTYIVYYSGPSHASGDWAMSDNGVVTLQLLLETWKEATCVDEGIEEENNDASRLLQRRQSRLILIIDSEHSHKWKKPLSRSKEGFVAIQTFYPQDLTSKNRHESDPEDVNTPFHGAFTQGFTKFNTKTNRVGLGEEVGDGEEGEGGVAGEEHESSTASNWFADFTQNGIRPTYAVTRRWTDFSFKLPSSAEFDKFSQTHFPRLLLPVLRCSTMPFIFLSSLCCCVEMAWKMARRCKMAWCPPAVLNLGHDFKLMRG